MGHWVGDHLNYYFAHYGYWTILVGIMLESAGIPLPGETILIVASIQAATNHQLNIFVVAAVAIFAAVVGDNLGYAAGRYGGRPLFNRYRKTLHIEESTICRGEELFAKHGSVTVFFARFIAGLRFLAGPLAGVLRMKWRRFMLFNALGAVAWVGVFVTLAYFFGEAFVRVLHHASWVIAAAVVAAVLYAWWRFARRKAATRPHGRLAA